MQQPCLSILKLSYVVSNTAFVIPSFPLLQLESLKQLEIHTHGSFAASNAMDVLEVIAINGNARGIKDIRIQATKPATFNKHIQESAGVEEIKEEYMVRLMNTCPRVGSFRVAGILVGPGVLGCISDGKWEETLSCMEVCIRGDVMPDSQYELPMDRFLDVHRSM